MRSSFRSLGLLKASICTGDFNKSLSRLEPVEVRFYKIKKDPKSVDKVLDSTQTVKDKS